MLQRRIPANPLWKKVSAGIREQATRPTYQHRHHCCSCHCLVDRIEQYVHVLLVANLTHKDGLRGRCAR